MMISCALYSVFGGLIFVVAQVCCKYAMEIPVSELVAAEDATWEDVILAALEGQAADESDAQRFEKRVAINGRTRHSRPIIHLGKRAMILDPDSLPDLDTANQEVANTHVILVAPVGPEQINNMVSDADANEDADATYETEDGLGKRVSQLRFRRVYLSDRGSFGKREQNPTDHITYGAMLFGKRNAFLTGLGSGTMGKRTEGFDIGPRWGLSIARRKLGFGKRNPFTTGLGSGIMGKRQDPTILSAGAFGKRDDLAGESPKDIPVIFVIGKRASMGSSRRPSSRHGKLRFHPLTGVYVLGKRFSAFPAVLQSIGRGDDDPTLYETARRSKRGVFSREVTDDSVKYRNVLRPMEYDGGYYMAYARRSGAAGRPGTPLRFGKRIWYGKRKPGGPLRFGKRVSFEED